VAIGMIDYNERDPEDEVKNIIELAFCMVDIVENVRELI